MQTTKTLTSDLLEILPQFRFRFWFGTNKLGTNIIIPTFKATPNVIPTLAEGFDFAFAIKINVVSTLGLSTFI